MNSYDQVPYKSHPFRQSHPDRLCVVAQLMGMSPPPVQTARVLELGCASGGNLIPMADQMPQGQFLGIDLSERQIQDGQTQIRNTGLTNVELRHANILEFDPGEGTYDYIICHGVYSWVPEVVQQKILEVCSRGLSPQGVAYISYNTFPGWHMRGMIRDIMRYRAGFFEAPTQKLSQARGLLAFLSESVKSENNPYGMLLANELSAISGADDSYLFHEHLEEINDPIYFHTFAERAESVGLQYLGESDIGTMSLDNFPERVRAMLQSASGNIIETEQYMDFLRNRMFRQTLLCRKEIELDRSLKPNRLIGMQVSSNARPEGPINLRSEERTLFKRGGSTLTTTEPEVKAAFLHLRDAWPQSVPFLELAAIARSQTGNQMVALHTDSLGPATQQMANTLLRCFHTGMVDLHANSPRFTLQVSDRPQASVLARTQAEKGSHVTDRKHGGVQLDDFQRQLLILLDGTLDHSQLRTRMAQRVEQGTLLLHSDGQRITTVDAATPVIDRVLAPCLDSLAKLGLLVE